MKYIFLDTNIFLHFQDFETIDWLSETSSVRCTIVIPPIVVDELDGKKIGTNKLSNRARKVLNRFEELIDSNSLELKKNVFFKILTKKPQRIVYEENELNFDEQDHRLIASIIEFRNTNEINDIELCTYDIGPRLRAKQFNIKTLKLSDKYLLPNQESEEEKKIKILERENRALKNRLPILSLRFSDSKEFIQFQIKNQEKNDFEKFKEKKINEIKTEYQYIKPIDPSENAALSIFNEMRSLTSNQITSYNSKLDIFYADFEKYVDKLFEFENKKNLTYEIQLIINNNGNIPADNVDIHLHFPDGFELLDSNHLDEKIDLPVPPYKPKYSFDHDFSTKISLPSINPMVNIDEMINFNSPSIKKTNSYDVDFYRKTLKHGYQEELQSLFIVFGTFIEIKNFQIDYEISADNIPEKLKGSLNVVFEK